MKNSTVLAAALAAGLITFAAHAQEGAEQAAMATAVPGIGHWTKDTLTERKDDGEPTRGLTTEEVFHAVEAAERDLAKAGKEAAEDVVEVASKAAEKSAAPYKDIIARDATENGVALELAHAVVTVESNYKANSRGSAGEVGLMQIKPATARLMGYRGSATGLFDPETNIKYGMKYLGKAQKLGGGTTCGTILKYNAGHGAKRMNPTSRNYCAKVKRHIANSGKPKVILASGRGA